MAAITDLRVPEPARFPHAVVLDPIKLVALAIRADALANAEACNPDLALDSEAIEIGPFDGTYLRLSDVDLVVAVDAARRLLDRIEEVVLDARQEAMEAERHDCSCGVRLEVDEITCGSPICTRRYVEELSL